MASALEAIMVALQQHNLRDTEETIAALKSESLLGVDSLNVSVPASDTAKVDDHKETDDDHKATVTGVESYEAGNGKAASDRLKLEVSNGKATTNGVKSEAGNDSFKKRKNIKTLIQVSNNKKPFVFYLNLAKKYIKQYNGVELSALGMAIPTVITISEILKSNGLAVQKNLKTSTVDSKDKEKGSVIQKAKIHIVLSKAYKNNSNITVAAAATPDTAIEATA